MDLFPEEVGPMTQDEVVKWEGRRARGYVWFMLRQCSIWWILFMAGSVIGERMGSGLPQDPKGFVAERAPWFLFVLAAYCFSTHRRWKRNEAAYGAAEHEPQGQSVRSSIDPV